MDTKIGETLRARLQSAQDYDTFDVNIFMRGEPGEVAAVAAGGAADFADSDAAAADAVNLLQEQAAASQRGVLELLTGIGTGDSTSLSIDDVSVPRVQTVESFWINNAVGAEVSRDVLEDLLARPDVVHVELTHHADIRELIDADGSSSKGSKGSKGARGGAKAGVGARAGGGAGKSASGRRRRKDEGGFDALDFVRSGVAYKFAADDETADAPQPTWSVRRVNAPLLWQKGLDGAGVVVAVVDSGVNYDHPDLRGHMWDGGAAFPNHGYDYASDDNDPRDEGVSTDGHGTACAGIVAGDGTSGTLTGVAPRATIMAVRVGGRERSFWRGLEFAIAQRAHVISMSMSWKFPMNPDYPGWRRVCEAILAARILHANSIGNQGDRLHDHPIPFNIATPGNCPPPRLHPLQSPQGGISSAISCGATDDGDRLAHYSGRGPAAWESGPFADYPFQNGARPGLIKPDVCAPGPGTVTCNWRFPDPEPTKPYRSFGGTSAATPHVGGCLALLAQACQRSGQPIVPARVQEALENTAVRIQGQSRDKENHFGAGRVDAFAAFKYGEARGWWA